MLRSKTVTLRDLVDEEAYEAELVKCAGVTGFHRWFFLRALSDALGLRFRAFAIDSGGSPAGVLPVLLRRRGPVSTANYLPVPHVGPVFRPPGTAELLAGALRAADRYLLYERVVVTKWSFAPGLEVDRAVLAGRRFELSEEENFVVPADRSAADHLASLPQKLRSEIRSGLARGMRAGPSTREEILSWFPARVTAPYERQGIAAAYPRAAATELAERLAADPRMLWRSVRAGDRVLAVVASIVDTTRLWEWLLAGERVKGPSPHLIVYSDAIEWSLSRGMACDFGGAPTPGIRDFKVRMGCVAEQCLTAERVRPKAYRAARRLHARISIQRRPSR
ncbi:MAG TPA: GNAT family N-acetyltransferase [Trebonia sp.]|nr:GNAT family N-acetyltransferase [Trebonia sp.]